MIQYDPRWEDKQANREKILNLLASRNRETDLVVLPELSLTGFTMRARKFSESEKGETTEFFSGLAAKNKFDVIFGFIEKEDDRYYNTLFHLTTDGNMAAKYRKIHPFSFSGENKYYASGTTPVITKINDIKLGLSICYDLRFPELFRHYAKSGAEVIINIANWPLTRSVHWHRLLQARAIENLCYMIGVNRIGRDKGNEYSGHSLVYKPFGELLIDLGEAENVSSVLINKEDVEAVRSKYPFLNDIRLL